MPERLGALLGAALLAAVGALSVLRPPRSPAVPPRVAPSAIEPWMCDALPGIGPLRRVDATRALRLGRIGELPKPARAAAAAVLVDPVQP